MRVCARVNVRERVNVNACECGCVLYGVRACVFVFALMFCECDA